MILAALIRNASRIAPRLAGSIQPMKKSRAEAVQWVEHVRWGRSAVWRPIMIRFANRATSVVTALAAAVAAANWIGFEPEASWDIEALFGAGFPRIAPVADSPDSDPDEVLRPVEVTE